MSTSVQAATQPRVQYAEKVALASAAGHAEFDAYGRRFALSLQSNDRALNRLKAAHPQTLAGYRLWRGALDGQPGSWTRLTEHAGRFEGAIWDGRDLYVVASYAQVANYLTTPMTAAPADTVVFRLSDTLDFLPKGYCATEPASNGLAANNGLVQYRNLVAELQVVASGPAQQIQMAEQMDMIQDLDMAVVQAVVQQLLKASNSKLRLAANISARSLMRPAFAEKLLTVMRYAQPVRGRLIFEITESAAIGDLQRADALVRGLRRGGASICLDGFGSGTASFDYLRQVCPCADCRASRSE